MCDLNAKDIAMLTPYAAQKVVHNHVRTQIHARTPSSASLQANFFHDKQITTTPAYAEVPIDTWEKIQGIRRDYVFVDLTSSMTVGFGRESTRLDTCLSRPRFGLIVVAGVNSIMAAELRSNLCELRVASVTPATIPTNDEKRRARQHYVQMESGLLFPHQDTLFGSAYKPERFTVPIGMAMEDFD